MPNVVAKEPDGFREILIFLCLQKIITSCPLCSAICQPSQCCPYQYLKYQSQSAGFLFVLLGGRGPGLSIKCDLSYGWLDYAHNGIL